MPLKSTRLIIVFGMFVALPDAVPSRLTVIVKLPNVAEVPEKVKPLSLKVPLKVSGGGLVEPRTWPSRSQVAEPVFVGSLATIVNLDAPVVENVVFVQVPL